MLKTGSAIKAPKLGLGKQFGTPQPWMTVNMPLREGGGLPSIEGEGGAT